MQTVSVIVTVLNERESIARLLDSLAQQSRTPDEVVIVDGGSRDGTVDLLHARAAAGALPLRVLVRPGANISQGRNAAIEAARGDVIASTDAGVQLTHDWLRALVAPFADEGVHVVSGVFVADAQTTFEVAMGATVLPSLSELSPDRFLPSSRSVAYRKSAWRAVGGYPEWLDYCEDLVYDLALRARYRTFAYAPQAVVRFRPRPDLRAFFRQYYRYARGDGKADLWRVRHAVRYLTYLALGPALIVLSIAHSPLWLIALSLGVALHTWRPYRRLSQAMAGMSLGQKLLAIALVPCIRLVGDVAKMVGYPVGWAWRLRHRDEIPAHRGQEGST
ncbi:MAG: glycosyltransferase [Anaerolineae bacterium]|nr:glycosyltransferase [Anaerolineae bacterium]